MTSISTGPGYATVTGDWLVITRYECSRCYLVRYILSTTDEISYEEKGRGPKPDGWDLKRKACYCANCARERELERHRKGYKPPRNPLAMTVIVDQKG